MIIDCISDLHGFYPETEGGDILIVAGDLTATDSHGEYLKFYAWLHKQKYKHYIFIAGNHDNLIEKDEVLTDCLANTTYLCDSGMEYKYFDDRFPEEDEGFLPSGHRTLKIWGSPWTKTFPGINPNCCAFTLNTDEKLSEKWALIPDDIDILITHSPSFGNYDITKRGESVGSMSLWMMSLVIRPQVHVFGHIHEGYGHSEHANGIHLVNASHVNERYQPVNKPIRIIL